jgi:light-regulated signal transduction histidine kinase (bacteriophytochrome)
MFLMEQFGNEMLLLMLNLSRLKDRNLIVRLFEEAVASAIPGVVVRRVEANETASGEVVELATPESSFGFMLVEDPSGQLLERELALYRNAIRMLAVVLENLSRFERLATENARLEAAVAVRTTELKQLTDELEHRVADRTAELTMANRGLETFAYSVSHDLQAPLRHMGSYLELARQRLGEPLRDDVREALDKASLAQHRMAQLIADLLSFSRLGWAEMNRTRVDLGELVRSITADLSSDVADRDVRWTVGELPEVVGDRALLRQVFANLLGNALKFTRTRSVAKIEVRASTSPDSNEDILSVRDNGVGFSMQYAGKLFGVFSRLHSVSEFEGTGIGLANVRQVIERHRGRVWAESAPDEGATFFFALPRDVKESL